MYVITEANIFHLFPEIIYCIVQNVSSLQNTFMNVWFKSGVIL
jgi:hypothetical protein